MSERRPPLFLLSLSRLRLFWREPSSVFWSYAFPILLTIALGIAFRNRPPEPVLAAVEAGPGAERIAQALSAAKDVQAQVLEPAAARNALRVGKVSLVVRPGNPREYAYDPTRPESRLARAVVDDVLQRADGRTDPTPVTESQVTEPGSRYVDFLVPGLLGVNLMSSGMWGIGWVIVEDRTRKLLKRMLATPMRRSDFLLSLVAQRLVFLFIEVPAFLLFAVFVFGVPVQGSLALLALISLLGALAFSGIGLLVGSRARNTQTVSGLINVVMMPMYLLSGVFFSSSNFPDVMQPFIKALPLTALNDALRAVMNEGAGVAAVWPQLALLSGVSVVTFAAALKLFRWE